MSLIDVLDKNGNKTGKIVELDEVHRIGYWHRGIDVWILNSKGELLVQKRSAKKKSNPNLWAVASVAGHVDAGEDSLIAALREIEEEIGVNLNGEDLIKIYSYTEQLVLNNGKFIDNEFDESFLVEKDLLLNDLVLQEEEVSDVKYVWFEDLEKYYTSGNPEYVSKPKESFEKIFDIIRERFTAAKRK
jgi:isopentenyldiphosphate isomerase